MMINKINEAMKMTKQSFKPDEQTKKERDAMLNPVTNLLQDYKASLGDGTQEFRGLASGFDEIDKLIGGLDRFVLLAGRSGAGKTTLALQLALGVANKRVPVLIYSFEMSKFEIITSLVKTTAHNLGLTGLFTNTIELQGNSPALPDEIKSAIEQSLAELGRTGERLYIKDSTNGIPKILPTADIKDKAPTIYDDVEQVKKKTGSDKVLVLIDSVQDVVPTDNPNQVQAEIKAVSDLTILQQKTGATILVTAQKNKGSVNSVDSYGDVMGSMTFIHKPNTVLELITPDEMIKKATADEKERLNEAIKGIEQDSKNGEGKPMFLNVIKGRFTGRSNLAVTYYGAYGYFEGKRATDRESQELYSLFD